MCIYVQLSHTLSMLFGHVTCIECGLHTCVPLMILFIALNITQYPIICSISLYVDLLCGIIGQY